MSKSFGLHRPRGKFRASIVCAVALAVGGLFVGVGCGGQEEEKAGEGESCSVSGDCETDLVCRRSVCVRPGGTDTGADSGEMDGGETDGSSDGGPEQEDYYISYVLESGRDAAGQLRVFNTADGSDVAVSPDSVNCSFNCWLSEDMKYFVHAQDAGAGAFDVFVAEVDSNLKAKGEGEKLVGGVQDISVEGGYVTYRKTGNSASNIAFYKAISGGAEKSVGSVEPDTGDWFVDPEHDIGVLYSIGNAAQTLEMTIGKANSRESDTSYTFGGSNFQEESGSYFGGNVLTTTSADGERMALVFTGAPNDYGSCTRADMNDAWSSEECDESKGFKCGEEGRCTRLEVTVHVIDVSKKGNLGQQCQYKKEGACGPIHKCDAPSDQKASQAECIPKRVVIGVPKTNQGPKTETSGCEWVEKDDSIDFTGVHGPLSFDDDGDVYLVGERDRSCIRSQFTEVPQSKRSRIGPNSQILRVDPEEGSYETLAGLPADKLFDPGACYNSEEQELEITEDCHVWVDRARVSPGGDEVAFTATNPNTASWPKSADFINLWHMLSDGTDRRFTGDADTDTLDTTTEYLRVHTKSDN